LVGPVESLECAICMDHAACMVLIPCGHVCFCQSCATPDQLRRLQMICPMCRRQFSQAIRLYGGRVVAE
jgi:E3 ubiquitin-protein ligase XIAP/baculoviral IAP repeat-containing protein 7/8